MIHNDFLVTHENDVSGFFAAVECGPESDDRWRNVRVERPTVTRLLRAAASLACAGEQSKKLHGRLADSLSCKLIHLMSDVPVAPKHIDVSPS